MDNGGAHKSNLIKNVITSSQNTLLYSVLGETRWLCYPYRPKTNAIESWFNQFKHYFKYGSNSYTYIDLNKNVKKVIAKISKISYLNYINYAYVNKENINLKYQQKDDY